MKAIAQNQKTATSTTAKPQAAVPVQAPEVERPDLATQLASAARLGHRLHAVNIHNAKESTVPVQRATQAQPDMAEDEEDLVGQARFASAPSSLRNGIPSIQRAELPQAMEDEDEEKPVGQLKAAPEPIDTLPAEASPNKTGLPDGLKAGLEHYSGMDMSGVKVRYNSAKPAQLQALAYTQGTDIHVGPGQEAHLPHEGWHVVQQMQCKVKPTMQMKGVSINDDTGLEKEADVMGAKAEMIGSDALSQGKEDMSRNNIQARSIEQSVQRKVVDKDLLKTPYVLGDSKKGAFGTVQASLFYPTKEHPHMHATEVWKVKAGKKKKDAFLINVIHHSDGANTFWWKDNGDDGIFVPKDGGDPSPEQRLRATEFVDGWGTIA